MGFHSAVHPVVRKRRGAFPMAGRALRHPGVGASGNTGSGIRIASSVYICLMRKLPYLVLILALVAAPGVLQAQIQACLVPDSIAVRGNERLSRNAVIIEAGVQAGDTLDQETRQRALRNLHIS